MSRSRGKALEFSLKCKCPCSTPLERNSSTICNKRPSIINTPMPESGSRYTSGSNSRTVTAKRYAPLKASKSLNPEELPGFRKSEIIYPIATAIMGSK